MSSCNKQDPRTTPYYQEYPRVQSTPDTLPPDYCALLSLLCGLIALITNNKGFSWCSLFLCFGSISNIKFSEIDYTQCFTTLVFSIMSIITVYLGGLPFTKSW